MSAAACPSLRAPTDRHRSPRQAWRMRCGSLSYRTPEKCDFNIDVHACEINPAGSVGRQLLSPQYSKRLCTNTYGRSLRDLSLLVFARYLFTLGARLGL